MLTREYEVEYDLNKISSIGSLMKHIYSFNDYPTEIDPNHSNYHIYYRQ